MMFPWLVNPNQQESNSSSARAKSEPGRRSAIKEANGGGGKHCPFLTAGIMARRLCSRVSLLSSLSPHNPLHQSLPCSRVECLSDSFASNSAGQLICAVFRPILFQVSRAYARGNRKHYDLFGQGVPGSKEFRKAWTKQLDDEDCVWTASEDESDSEKLSPLEKEIRKVRQRAKEHSDRIDADDSDELWSVWSGSDEEKTLWTGSEEDEDDDIPTEPYPNEKSDAYIDKLFEFEEPPKYRTLSEVLKAEDEPEELSPGKKARKLAVENALKKLKKGPDGRYTNVWEVMSDLDILIGAFENIVSGPEYAELRQGGPKQLNMEFFKDIQAKMRDRNYKFSPELKLKPKSKFVSKKKWQKAQSRRRKDKKR